MKKTVLTTLAASAAFFAPHAAFAQSNDGPEVTVGAIAGLHDLGVFDGDEVIDGFEVTDNGAIFGGFVAVDFPLSERLFAGIEANAALGTEAIEAEYGASVRLGIRTQSGTKFYVRGGYQEVDIDALGVVNIDDDLFDEDDLGIDTTAGDYLVGAGVDVPIGNIDVRLNLDTIAFDSVRATAGIGFRF